METQSLPNSANHSTNVDENSPTTSTTLNLSEMTTKTVEEISARIEQVFAKLQRNLEHNTRVFQEKSNGLLAKIDQAEEQLRKVLSQLETATTNSSVNKNTATSEASSSSSVSESPVLEDSPMAVGATESIALSEETTKLEADETTDN